MGFRKDGPPYIGGCAGTKQSASAMDALAALPGINWLAVPVTAGLLGGRPIAVAAVTVVLLGALGATHLLDGWWSGTPLTAADLSAIGWALLQRALYVAGALVALVPATVAKGHRVYWDSSGHHARSWQSLAALRQLVLVVLLVLVAFSTATWGERAQAVSALWGWQPPIGRLTSVTIFIALVLAVRHWRALDSGIATLWTGTVTLAALAPGGASALALTLVFTGAFLFSSTSWRR